MREKSTQKSPLRLQKFRKGGAKRTDRRRSIGCPTEQSIHGFDDVKAFFDEIMPREAEKKRGGVALLSQLSVQTGIDGD